MLYSVFDIHDGSWFVDGEADGSGWGDGYADGNGPWGWGNAYGFGSGYDYGFDMFTNAADVPSNDDAAGNGQGDNPCRGNGLLA